MQVLVRELRSLPTWLLREYLEELGGQVTADDCITGPGWQARIIKMEDFSIGSLSVGQIRLEWQGNDLAYQTVWPQLEQKLARAGG